MLKASATSNGTMRRMIANLSTVSNQSSSCRPIDKYTGTFVRMYLYVATNSAGPNQIEVKTSFEIESRFGDKV